MNISLLDRKSNMKIGIDICEHNRFNNDNLKLILRILSNDEIDFFNSIKDKKRQIEYVASRFAAKEAIFKAYQEGDKTLNYKDISILNKPNGAPYVFSNKLNDEINISISHSDNYSVAMVIIP